MQEGKSALQLVDLRKRLAVASRVVHDQRCLPVLCLFFNICKVQWTGDIDVAKRFD